MKKATLKEFLSEKISEELHELIPRGFEIIGDIGIIEIPLELELYKKEIGETLLKLNSHIKVALKKTGIHSGEFRTQDMEHIAGENRKETIYLENGVRMKLNVETVYFSSKLGTERAYISENVKKNSSILVMFSGCGPYTFNILKKQPNVKKIDSIEINPEGHKYALENISLNKNLLKKSDKFKKIIATLKQENKPFREKDILAELNSEIIGFYCGDVRKILQSELSEEKYDEIIMPLPKDASLFLDCAFRASKKRGLIHMYDFVHENDFPYETENKVKKEAKKYGVDIEIIETRKVGQYSPRKYRVCCDFKVK